MTVGWACQLGLVGIVLRLCLDPLVFSGEFIAKNTTPYTEWGEGFKNPGMYSEHCVKPVILKFNLYMRHVCGKKKENKCHSLSSKGSDKPNPKTCFHSPAILHDWHVVHNMHVFLDSWLFCVLILLVWQPPPIFQSILGRTVFFVLRMFCFVAEDLR